MEHWLDCPGTLEARVWKFSVPLKHFLGEVHTVNVFRASRSHWQDVVCDDLVRTPSTAAAAAASAL